MCKFNFHSILIYFHQGRNWKNSDDTKGYSAIVQWPSSYYATSCLNFFESFEHISEYSKITACVALPDTFLVEIPFPARKDTSNTGIAEIVHRPHPKKKSLNYLNQLKKSPSKPVVDPETINDETNVEQKQQQPRQHLQNPKQPQQQQNQPQQNQQQQDQQQQDLQQQNLQQQNQQQQNQPHRPQQQKHQQQHQHQFRHHNFGTPPPLLPLPTTFTTPSNYTVFHQHQQQGPVRSPFFRAAYPPPQPPPLLNSPIYVQNPRNMVPSHHMHRNQRFQHPPNNHHQQHYHQHQQHQHQQIRLQQQLFQHESITTMNMNHSIQQQQQQQQQQQNQLKQQHQRQQPQQNQYQQHQQNQQPPPLMQQDLSKFAMMHPRLIHQQPIQHPTPTMSYSQENPSNHQIQGFILPSPMMQQQNYDAVQTPPSQPPINNNEFQTNSKDEITNNNLYKTTSGEVLNKVVGSESRTKISSPPTSTNQDTAPNHTNDVEAVKKKELHSDIRTALNKIIANNKTIEENDGSMMSTPPAMNSSTASNINNHASWNNTKSTKRWSATKKSTSKNAFHFTEEENNLKKKKEEKHDEDKGRSRSCWGNGSPISQLFGDNIFSIKSASQQKRPPSLLCSPPLKATDVNSFFCPNGESPIQLPVRKSSKNKLVSAMVNDEAADSPSAEPFIVEEDGEEEISGVKPVKTKSLLECMEVREERSRFLSIFIKAESVGEDDDDDDSEMMMEEKVRQRWNKTDSTVMQNLLTKRRPE